MDQEPGLTVTMPAHADDEVVNQAVDEAFKAK
jgi:hypothetical protein